MEFFADLDRLLEGLPSGLAAVRWPLELPVDVITSRALEAMGRARVTVAPLVDEQGRPAGQADLFDLLTVPAQPCRELPASRWSRAMPSLLQEQPLGRLALDGEGLVAVVDRQGCLAGVVDRGRRQELGRELLEGLVWAVLGGPAAFLLADREGVVRFLNRSASELLGQEVSLLDGRKLAEAHPQTRLLETLASGSEVRSLEPVGEGYVRSVYHPLCLAGQGVGALACFLEPSSRELEKELEATRVMRQIFGALLDDQSMGFMVVNGQGEVILLNPAYARFLGTEEARVLGRPVSHVAPFSCLEQVVAGGQGRVTEELPLGGEDYLLSEVPITFRGETVGGLGKLIPHQDARTREWLEKYSLLEGKLAFYRNELRQFMARNNPLEALAGASPALKGVKEMAGRVAGRDVTVLIRGESGTGKEVLSRALHQLSPRREEPFVVINCAAIPENLLEAELFGYEEGAFTGAARGGRPGKFELAEGGTLLLDEVGDTPLAMQAKLLRALQEKKVERVGGNRERPVNVRLLAATNRDLTEMVARGQFRLDLFYRLSVITLHLPPLRERLEDLPGLVEAILKRFNERYSLAVEGAAPDVLALFTRHSWPGNVRELENVLEYAFNFLEEGERIILRRHLPFLDASGEGGSLLGRETLAGALAEREKEAIRRALAEAGGNKMQAARLLGIHRSALYKKMARYALEEGKT